MTAASRLIARIPGAATLLCATLLLVLAVAQPDGAATGALVAVAALGVTALLAVRLGAALTRRRSLRIGSRSPRHAESLDREAEPSHPATAGRPRPRAPGALAATA